jgi:hypothetical protein
VPLVFEDRGIAGVCEGTRVAITHTRQVVLILTESLRDSLALEGAVTMVDHSPYDVVLEHWVSYLIDYLFPFLP